LKFGADDASLIGDLLQRFVYFLPPQNDLPPASRVVKGTNNRQSEKQRDEKKKKMVYLKDKV